MPAVSVPSPIGGWNASDSLDKMPATDAVRLVNFIPRAGYVQSRNGCAVFCSGLGGSVETVMPYAGTASSKLLAAANGNVWNVTTGTASSLASGFTNNAWQYTNHSNRLIMVNGADTPQVYNGTTLSAASFAGSPGGLTPANLWNCNTFKGRVFYWEDDVQAFWYAAAGSYQGALAQFDMSTQLQSGGTLVQMVNWTLDSGSGVDDLAVFIFSTGEVLVYQGDNPGDANAWSLIGRFQIGSPLGPRAHDKVGGTEIILTRDGYVDLSAALQDGRYSEKTAYSAKIIRAAKAAASEFGSFSGWQALLYPAGNLFIVNVPIGTAASRQHVRETSSGGWCEFTGWNARSFCVFNDRLYFGDPSGNVCRADFSTTDNGARIQAWGVPAFNALGSRAQRKQLTAASAVTNWQRPATLAYDGLADFNLALRSTLVDDDGSPAAAWDASEWDTSSWGVQAETLPVYPAWKNANATGYVLTLSLRVSQKAHPLIWYATNYQYRNAGVI